MWFISTSIRHFRRRINIIDLIMREEKPLERKVTIRNDRLQKYFPASYTPKQMEDVIIKLLEGWHRKRQQEQAR